MPHQRHLFACSRVHCPCLAIAFGEDLLTPTNPLIRIHLSRRIFTIAATLSLAIAVSSCKKHGGYLTDPTPVAVTQIKVSPQVVQLPAVGTTQQLAVVISPADATDRIVIWESTDPSIASVDENGRVTAKSAGVGVFITAYSHDRQHQSSVNVSVNP